MSYPTITLAYTRPNGSVRSLTLPRPDISETETLEPRQEVKRTLGGTLFVYSRGPETRSFRWRWSRINAAEHAALVGFFGPAGVDKARRWWRATWEPTRYEVVRAGMITGGVGEGRSGYAPRTGGTTVKCGTFTCGAHVLPDTITFVMRLTTPTLEIEEPENGFFSVDVVVEALPFPYIDNAC